VASSRPVKTPESPRSYLPKLSEPPAPEEREEKILPRYIELAALREQGFGPRNLFWGVATLLLALVLLVVALFFAGPKAVVCLATALLTFTALFVLARLHVFRQRNGAFFALAVVCLLGVAIPLVESSFGALKNIAARPPVTTTPEAILPSAETPPPLLTQSFALSKPDGPGKQVKVIKDSRVVIDHRPFLIKAGDVFPLVELVAGEATFAVRDLRVSLPANVVEVIDPNAVAQGVTGARPQPAVTTNVPPPAAAPSADDLAAITMSAQREAIRRYPALGIKNSLENEAFVSTYQQLKEAGSTEFFTNPEWPIELAELLAKRESWTRGGLPSSTGPAPVLDPPGNLPPVDMLDAGAGLPQSDRGAR
jgi:hypothetical protein